MSGGRKKVAPRATHQPAQQYLPIPGNNTDGLNTKVGRAREKAARKAAKRRVDEQHVDRQAGKRG